MRKRLRDRHGAQFAGLAQLLPCKALSPLILIQQLVLFFLSISSSYSEPLPVSVFARVPAMAQARLSPDGRYVLFLAQMKDRRVVLTMDRANGNRVQRVLDVPADGVDRFRECRWANETRVVCILSRETLWRQHTTVNATLLAVNADGTGYRNLFEGTYRFGEFNELIDMTPHEPRSVLVQIDRDVYEIDVYTRAARRTASSMGRMSTFRADAKGDVHLAYGTHEGHFHLFFRARTDEQWRKIGNWQLTDLGAHFVPKALIEDGHHAYSIGPGRNHLALWQFDLENNEPTTLVYEDAEHDVADVVLSWHRKLLGVRLNTDDVSHRYLDKRAASVVQGARSSLSKAGIELVDTSANESIYLIRSHSDTDGGTYHVLDARTGQGELEQIGTAYPELPDHNLASVRPVTFRARDGKEIRAVLAVPLREPSSNASWVVLTQASATDKASREFSFLRHFLTSRGYSVLQINHRGGVLSWSNEPLDGPIWGSGAGYFDVVDGVRAALNQMSIDPQRVAVAGWGEGGRLALLAIQRDPDLFKCAISIGGVTDLQALASRTHYNVRRDRFRELFEADRQWLERESPLSHAREAQGSTLLIHGTRDAVVDVSHSRAMARELRRHRQNHQLLVLDGANHEVDDESDRAALLMTIESFLLESCSSQ